MKLIEDFFINNKVFLLDGGTGTELDRRGVNVDLPLWSAGAILNAPEVLREVHLDYLRSGANGIVTNTFRTHARTLEKVGFAGLSESLTSKAVEIACSARDEIDKKSFVFGSVSPLEDCYQPNLSPDEDVCFLEHSRMISLLVDSGVDSVLIETMCSHQESVGAIKAIEKNNVKSWGISFTFMSDKEPGILLDGTSIKELIPYLEKASFVGVNCVSYFEIINQVKFLKNVLPEGMLIMSCGNIGQVDEVGGWINPENCQSNIYASHVMGWVKAGAGIVGGCCGTTPGTIAAMRKSIRSMN